jgi:exosortase H (IPTLxxWG-CTERM-specific)
MGTRQPDERRGGGTARPGGGVYARRPVLAFVVTFAVVIGVFYALTFIPFMHKQAIPAYTRLNARVSGGIMNLFGEQAQVQGTVISSRRYTVDVAHGCDAVPPSILFISAVLAFPASLKAKLPGILIGTVLLAIINLARIVSLFYTGVYYPRAFEVMHVDVWQPAFIVISLVLWVFWAWQVTQGPVSLAHVSVQTA